MANNPQRKYREFADIKELIKLTGVKRNEVKKYFKQYKLEADLNEVLGKGKRS